MYMDYYWFEVLLTLNYRFVVYKVLYCKFRTVRFIHLFQDINAFVITAYSLVYSIVLAMYILIRPL
jgi:hypothetical protein